MVAEFRDHRFNGLLPEHLLPGDAVLVIHGCGDLPSIVVTIAFHITLGVIQVIFIPVRLKLEATTGLLKAGAQIEPRRLMPHQRVFAAAEVIKEVGVIHRGHRTIQPVSLPNTKFITTMVEIRQGRVGINNKGHVVIVTHRESHRASPTSIGQTVANK